LRQLDHTQQAGLGIGRAHIDDQQLGCPGAVVGHHEPGVKHGEVLGDQREDLVVLAVFWRGTNRSDAEPVIAPVLLQLPVCR
jgi:hypothetical protein